ncbi:R-linalool synthase-like [Zingiber officinale]|uniref:R-linalool synthase-like n=1 Tax=Zingiber officinale TaxID=94328 RepID=UPI001C4B42F8|nr:R-linalool synthase-like [Zingiber officinale]
MLFGDLRWSRRVFPSSRRHQAVALPSTHPMPRGRTISISVDDVEEVGEFTTKHLKNLLEEEGSLKPGLLREQVAHALELPLNWRFQRLHAKWFIGAWQRDPAMDPALLLLAKLDFNALQNIYKRELNELSRWWRDLGLPQKLPFFRDRLTENYLWSVVFAFEPDSWSFREMDTKMICFITMIDDVYDVYGTLDELEIFTDIMVR